MPGTYPRLVSTGFRRSRIRGHSFIWLSCLVGFRIVVESRRHWARNVRKLLGVVPMGHMIRSHFGSSGLSKPHHLFHVSRIHGLRRRGLSQARHGGRGVCHSVSGLNRQVVHQLPWWDAATGACLRQSQHSDRLGGFLSRGLPLTDDYTKS